LQVVLAFNFRPGKGLDMDVPGGSHLKVLVGGAAGADDDELVRDFLEGDEDAFAELWRRHHPVVHLVVRRYVATPEDARDLVQRAFLRALTAVRRAARRAPVPFRPWLLRIAVNLGKNHARDERRWRRGDDREVAERADPAPRADEILERRRREEAVRSAVLELPRRQREVLTLRVDADLSFAEVAATLGITETNARVHYHHATKRLGRIVRERQGSEETP
jgi:RNA polymerase sigma-70 factor (ECF subfamily)